MKTTRTTARNGQCLLRKQLRRFAATLAICLVTSAGGGSAPAADSPGESSPTAAKHALGPEPFGKGIFAYVRAGGKIKASEATIRNWAGNPYIAGTQLSYCWSELEVREGEYRWDIIEKPKGVSTKQMRDSRHVAKLMDIYQGAIGDDHDPRRQPFSRLSYLPLAERAANVETEEEWNAALKWAWEHLEK